MDQQITYDNHHDESNTRTRRYNKLAGDGDPCAPNIITENLVQKKINSGTCTPMDQASDKKLRPQPTKVNSFKSGPS